MKSETVWAVRVTPPAVAKVCNSNLRIWVKDAYHNDYVTKKDRGEWRTKQEANAAITEPYEVAIEVTREKQ